MTTHQIGVGVWTNIKYEVFQSCISITEYLKKPLDEYIKKYPKIRIVRSHRRLGIISNRMLGAVNAVGPVLVNVSDFFRSMS